jgi:soluble lytic murein transglycosylase-like protein
MENDKALTPAKRAFMAHPATGSAIVCLFITIATLIAMFGMKHTARKAQAVTEAPAPMAIAQVESQNPLVIPRDVVSAYIVTRNPTVFPELAEIFVNAIYAASEEFGVPPSYLVALITVESGFNYQAVSNKDCVGLMQINHRVWLAPENENGVSLTTHGIARTRQDLFNPVANVRAGAYILRHYMDASGSPGKLHMIDYAVTRYLGGSKNDHYDNMLRAVGELYVFCQLYRSLQAQSQTDKEVG